MTTNSLGLKQALLERKTVIGSWVSLAHPGVVEVMLSSRPDWLCFDLEHTCTDLETVQNLITITQLSNIPALVRVPLNEPIVIKKVMDAGATGIIVPMIKSAKEAAQAVSHAYYPPFGTRGVGLNRAQKYGIGFEEYRTQALSQTVVIAQIEHVDSLPELEGILTTPGIDGIMVGPYDLSASMGFPGDFERKEVREAIAFITKKTLELKKTLGFHVISSDHSKVLERLNEGYNFIAFSLDFLFLGDKVRSEMDAVRKHCRGKDV